MMIYILSKIVKYDEFLSLSFEELVKLISYDDLVIPHEEKRRGLGKYNNMIVIFFMQRLYVMLYISIYINQTHMPQTIHCTSEQLNGLQKYFRFFWL
ncbi:uncharacterized protein LOC111029101 [Myzus persicae]|uniref:uncharacterized protein LOC111029101 n=1 Tax=Myzus persicae TaxID=13164 RepID=UPI000B933C4B|nr:uncharacterized protein LOC111029101 [Myzus persicae]